MHKYFENNPLYAKFAYGGFKSIMEMKIRNKGGYIFEKRAKEKYRKFRESN